MGEEARGDALCQCWSAAKARGRRWGWVWAGKGLTVRRYICKRRRTVLRRGGSTGGASVAAADDPGSGRQGGAEARDAARVQCSGLLVAAQVWGVAACAEAGAGGESEAESAGGQVAHWAASVAEAAAAAASFGSCRQAGRASALAVGAAATTSPSCSRPHGRTKFSLMKPWASGSGVPGWGCACGFGALPSGPLGEWSAAHACAALAAPPAHTPRHTTRPSALGHAQGHCAPPSDCGVCVCLHSTVARSCALGLWLATSAGALLCR